MAASVGAAVAKARRDVVSHFLSRNAVTPQSAVPYQPERRLRAKQFERLQEAGVLKVGTRGGWYLDAPEWDAYSRKLRRRMGAMLGVSAAVAGALVAVFA
jgi:hypothetical protein